MDQLLLRRLGDLGPVIGGLAAAVGLVFVARAVERSGCTGDDFGCWFESLYVGALALIPGFLVAIGVLWVAARAPTDAAGGRRPPGPALMLGAGGAIGWVLVGAPLGVYLLLSGLGAIPLGGEPGRGLALTIAAIVAAVVVMLIGLVAVRTVRRGLGAVVLFMLAGAALVCVSYLWLVSRN